jgi:hypothetical protein
VCDEWANLSSSKKEVGGCEEVGTESTNERLGRIGYVAGFA